MANQGKQKLEWAEPLPDACPPKEAKEPNGEQYYRLVESFPPTEHDFYSQRMCYPKKVFSAGECIARSVSLLNSYDECLRIKKLATHKHKNEIIVGINLPQESGVIMPTFKSSHFSWWRSKNFDPIPCCEKARN